jgi:hypothetical protein
LLAGLEATGIKVTCRGDNLRLRVKRGVNLDPFLDQITAHKPALLTLLALQDEIVRTASAAQDAFDRQHYDRLWERWHALHDQETF